MKYDQSNYLQDTADKTPLQHQCQANETIFVYFHTLTRHWLAILSGMEVVAHMLALTKTQSQAGKMQTVVVTSCQRCYQTACE